MSTDAWHNEPERSSTKWIQVVIWIYHLLGKRFCEILMWPVSGFFFLIDTRGRRASLEYLNVIFREQRSSRFWSIRRFWLSYQHFYEFARSLLDKFAVWQGGVQFESLSFDGKDQLRDLADREIGAVVISAHLGNIEVLRSVAQDFKGRKVNALMFTEHNPGFNTILQSTHPEFGFRIIPTESPGPQLLLELQNCIERGEMVAMLADRLMPGSPEKSVSVTFLGKETQLPIGPFLLASLLECPVFLVFCFRDGRGYHSYFELFEERIQLPRKTRQEALKGVAQKFADRLEHYCKKFPLQWYNFYSYWQASASREQSEPETISGIPGSR